MTDIWSLGVVLYELAALEHPFSGKNLMALANAISKGKYDPIPEHYSTFLVDLIAAMLNKDQSKRPRIREILGWLDNVLDEEDMNDGNDNGDNNNLVKTKQKQDTNDKSDLENFFLRLKKNDNDVDVSLNNFIQLEYFCL